MISHDEAAELLAPMALDALDDDVRAQIEEHILTCPRCRVELDGHREVASAIGSAYAATPEHLWEKISSRLYEREGSFGSGVPELVLGEHATSNVVGIARHPSFSRRVKTVLAVVSIAAAAAIVGLGVNLANANSHVATLNQALSDSSQNAALAALAAPDHKVVTLKNSADVKLAQFVVLPDGNGYLISSSLKTLATDKTYQLWGIVNGSPVSIGVMGRSPKGVSFTLASSPAPSVLGVTVEPSGGVLTPAKKMVASGPV